MVVALVSMINFDGYKYTCDPFRVTTYYCAKCGHKANKSERKDLESSKLSASAKQEQLELV